MRDEGPSSANTGVNRDAGDVSPDVITTAEDLPAESSGARVSLASRVGRWVGPILGLFLIAGAIVVLQRQLEQYSYSDVVNQLSNTPLLSIGLALLLSAGAYTALVGYDAIALSYVGHSLSFRRVALGSFVAHAMSHSLGFHMITAGSIRFRFWSAWGLPKPEIARALGFASSSFLLGMILVCGLVLLFEPPDTMALLHLPTAPLRVVGALLVAGAIGFLLWMRLSRRPLRVFGIELQIPKVRLALGHLLIAASDWVMAASVAYVLLPAGHGVGLLQFIGIFLFALLVGAIGHVPGGVGVFEALVVVMLKPWLDPPAVLGSMILYRVLYYVVPFVIGVVLMLVHEFAQQQLRMRAARWIPATMPVAMGTAVFSAGTVLLLSSAVNMNVDRMTAVQSVIPLALIEVSHLVASLLGAALLLLAWFLQRRMERAFVAVTICLALAAVASLMRGLVWEVSLGLTVVLLALLPSRGLFTRKGRLSLEPLSVAWGTGIVTVLILTVWLGFFSFKGVGWSAELWRQISLTSDLSRFLRATAASLLLVVGTWASRVVTRGRDAVSTAAEP